MLIKDAHLFFVKLLVGDQQRLRHHLIVVKQ